MNKTIMCSTFTYPTVIRQDTLWINKNKDKGDKKIKLNCEMCIYDRNINKSAREHCIKQSLTSRCRQATKKKCM